MHQLGKAGWQLVVVRHSGPRDHADVAGQRGLELQAHEVFGVVQASSSCSFSDITRPLNIRFERLPRPELSYAEANQGE